MLSTGFLLSKTMTGKVSQSIECEPDYLLEKVWYEDVSTEFAKARCKVLRRECDSNAQVPKDTGFL